MTEPITIRVKDLTSVQSPASDTVVLTDSAADGVHKRALADIEDTAANKATSAVSAITARAEAAAAQATDAKNAANAAAASAGTAAEDAQEATEAALEAIEAMGDISELAVPTMSPAIRGGAKLGDGLSLVSDVLSLGPLTKSAQGASVETDGCALYAITGEGWAEQDGTPTPESPQPIRVCRGRNLLDTSTATPSKMIDSTGAIVSANSYYAVSDFIEAEPGDYVCSGFGSAYAGYCNFYDSSKAILETVREADTTFVRTAPAGTAYMRLTLRTGAFGKSQLERGSTPTPYVPYGHVGIEVQREDVSRVVFDGSDDEIWALTSTANLFSVRVYGAYAASAAADNNVWNDVYTTSQTTSNANQPDMSTKISAGGTYIYIRDNRYSTVDDFKAYIAENPLTFYYLNDKHTGSVPYFPTTTTSVPLPSKGWTGAAGDYADALSIDSAGGYRWDVETGETVLNGSESWAQLSTTESGKYRNYATIPGMAGGFTATTTPDPDVMADRFMSIPNDYDVGGTRGCNVGMHRRTNGDALIVIYHEGETAADFATWLTAHNVTLLHPLATPTTESGYITLPDLPPGAVVSIPELEEIGVSWFVEGAQAAVEHGNNVLRRAQAENEEIEDALADLAERVAALEA